MSINKICGLNLLLFLLFPAFLPVGQGGGPFAQERDPGTVDGQESEIIQAGEQEMTLVWSDEFNVDGAPDPDNWIFETGFVRNNEHQLYQTENAFVKDGLLIIEGRRERVRNPDYDPESSDWRESREYANYTSASMQTRGLHSWQFGRFEMRAKIDAREGLWPAFWTLGSGRWPYGGETDIMEYYDDSILANAAWGSESPGNPVWDSEKIPLSDFGENWADEFHIWRMDWNEEIIRLSVDGRLLNEIDLSQTLNPDGTNPFHHPHYLLVNMAIGGNAGGDPSETTFPALYQIDYIRVYQ